jgi:hypothetical protein
MRRAASRPTRKAVGQLELDHRLAMLDAGVVDQDVDGQAVAVERLEGLTHRCLVSHVEGGPAHGQTFGLQQRYRFVDGGLLAAVDHHRGARLGQPARQRQADAAGGAGDEGRTTGQVEQGRAGASIHGRKFI